MRRFAREHPGRIGIFKMEHPVGTTHWRKDEPVLRFANVSSQNFLVPNVPGRLGRGPTGRRGPAAAFYDGDYAFIARTVRTVQDELVFVDEVTGTVAAGP